MHLYLIKLFGVSLMLTWLIEMLAFRLVTGSLTGREAKLVALVNLLTNPAAVWLVWAAGTVFYPPAAGIAEIFTEVLAILAEAVAYRSFSRAKGWTIKRPALTAVTANIASWGMGLLMQGI